MRVRMVLGAMGWGIALLALAACTSTIPGAPTFAGPTQTTDATTEESTTEESPTEETTTGDTDEFVACLTVPYLYETANTNFIALADATNNGTPTDLTSTSVAGDFAAAVVSAQTYLDPLPVGAVRDTVQAAQDAAGALRDGLLAGSPVSNTDLNTAVESLATACEF